MSQLREIFESMHDVFQKDKAEGIDAVILFDISGEGGGQWRVAVKEGELRVTEEPVERPTLTISATADDYINISTGKLNEQLAFMTGKIKAAGDMRLAMRMPMIFKR